MKKIALILLTSIYSLNAFSGETGTGYISRIYPTGNVMYFKLKDDSCNPANKYYYFNVDSDVKKIWATMIISAATAKNKITVNVPSCGFQDHTTINYIYQDIE